MYSLTPGGGGSLTTGGVTLEHLSPEVQAALSGGGGGGGLNPAQNIFGVAGAETLPAAEAGSPFDLALAMPDPADPGFVVLNGAKQLAFRDAGLYAIYLISEGTPVASGVLQLEGTDIFPVLFAFNPHPSAPDLTKAERQHTFALSAPTNVSLFYTKDQAELISVYACVLRLG